MGLSCAKIGEIEDGGHTHEGGWREDDRTGNRGMSGMETGDMDDNYKGSDRDRGSENTTRDWANFRGFSCGNGRAWKSEEEPKS